MKKYRRGMVALSADPITLGHLDLVRRAREECESLVVLIANNDLKQGTYLFSHENRVAMTERAINEMGLDRVVVIGSDGLLVDVYLREDCDAIFRGIRNEQDKAYEVEQMALHALIVPAIAKNVRCLEASEEYRMVSSSLVKSWVSHGLDVSRFVPIAVKQALEERLLGQYKVALTGGMASGKTFLGQALVRYFSETLGIPAVHIGIDALQRELYREVSLGAQSIREALSEMFGREVLTEDGLDVNRPVLKSKLFDPGCSPAHRERVHALVAPHIGRKYREAVSGKNGLILFEWAQLAEMRMGHWTNNHAIVVESVEPRKMLAERGIEAGQAADVASHQWSARRKAEALYEQALADLHGHVVTYTNQWSDNISAQPSFIRLAAEIQHLFPGLERMKRVKNKPWTDKGV